MDFFSTDQIMDLPGGSFRYLWFLLTEVILIVSSGLYSHNNQSERMDYARTPGFNIEKYRLEDAYK